MVGAADGAAAPRNRPVEPAKPSKVVERLLLRYMRAAVGRCEVVELRVQELGRIVWRTAAQVSEAWRKTLRPLRDIRRLHHRRVPAELVLLQGRDVPPEAALLAKRVWRRTAGIQLLKVALLLRQTRVNLQWFVEVIIEVHHSRLSTPWARCQPKARNHTVRHEVSVVHAAIVQRVEARVLLGELLLMVELLKLLLLLQDLQVYRSLTKGAASRRQAAGLVKPGRCAMMLSTMVQYVYR